jgi:EmrB/QacA subfamily drug resistance transporter
VGSLGESLPVQPTRVRRNSFRVFLRPTGREIETISAWGRASARFITSTCRAIRILQTQQGGTTATKVSPAGPNHQLRALLSMVGVALLLNYVETMIIPGIPTIQNDFSTTPGVVSWVTSAFLIVGSAVSPLFGKLGDSYGKKKMFLIALTFYTVGVALAGFSPSIYFLIGARAVQGIGFAIVPLALAIIAETFPRERIATAQGVVSATFAIGAAAGLVIGSYIVQDFGWQWAFHSAFILSIILFVVVWKVLPQGTPGTGLRVDYSTIVMLMAGVSLALLYLTEGPYEGWLSPVEIVSLAAGILLIVGFFTLESRRANPLIQLSLLKIRNVLVANGLGILSGISMFMLFFAVIYYTELPTGFGLNLDDISAGLTIAPATVLMLVAGPAIGRLVTVSGPKPAMFTGALITLAGFLLFIFNRETATDVVIATAVSLIGAVSLIIPIVNMISVSLPDSTVGTGLGLNTMLRNIGGAVGPVVATTIMSSYTVVKAVTNYHGYTGPFLGPTSSAFDYIFYLGIGAMLVAIVFSFAAKNYVFKKDGKSSGPPS